MNIVFDFGAVLFEWKPAELLRRHLGHLTPTAEAATQLARDMFHHEDWQGFDRGTRELHDVISSMGARLSLPSNLLHNFLNPIGELLTPIATSVALLDQLRQRRDNQGDIRLYYLSNMPIAYARTLEQRHDFIDWFDGGIFSGDVKLVKPQREIYELLGSRYGLEPSQTLFIDDLAANVEAADALGWQTIHCCSTASLPAQVLALLPGLPGQIRT